MSRSINSQKENLEYYAMTNFMAMYNKTHKRQLDCIQQCKPPKPDILCSLNMKQIGIEVAHTYGNRIEAAMRLGNRGYKDFKEEQHRALLMISLDGRALGSLNEVLKKKSNKVYSVTPLWLLIRNAFFLWSLLDYKKHKSRIQIPVLQPFDQIWFLCDQNSIGTPGIIRLA